MNVGLIAGLYFFIGVLVGGYIWQDAEFRPIERLPFALLGLIVWPLALPWYLVTRPASLVQDMTYEKSHQHYKDYVKTKGRDIGDGVTEDLARREEEARLEKERKEQLRKERGNAFDDDDDAPKVNRVVIGERPSMPVEPEPVGWGNIPGVEPPPPAAGARTGYSGDTRIGPSVRDRIYGDAGSAFVEPEAVKEPEPFREPVGGWQLGRAGDQAPVSSKEYSSEQSSASQPPLEAGWNLDAPPKPTPPARPTPSAPKPVSERTTSMRARLYADDDLVIPGVDEVRPPFHDHNIERLMQEGQLREAHRVAKRMLEMATRLGETEKQAGYQKYFQAIELRIVAEDVPLDD